MNKTIAFSMANNHFWSIYASYIEDFIRLKNSLGFKYETERKILSGFDKLIIESGETNIGISKELSDGWCAHRTNETDKSRNNRIVILRQFSSYLCDLGFVSYIPKLPRFRASFTPYVFAREQIEHLFKTCDNIRTTRRDMDSVIFSMPIIIRFLYSTGLRIGELLALNNEDVILDKDGGHCIVRDSKSKQERIIPLSASLVENCILYNNYKMELPVKFVPSDGFFVSLDGQRATYQGVHYWFKKLLRLADIPPQFNNKFIRVHDLRHTFAVHSLAFMAEAGMDLYCSLPILSTYLGHGSLQATDNYVRLTAEMYPDLLRDVDMLCLEVFPKNVSYETY